MTNKVTVVFNWERSTFSPNAKSTLGKLAQRNIETFFKYFSKELTISVITLSASAGKAKDKLIVLDPVLAKKLRDQKSCSGVVVQIYTEGTQALHALVTVDGVTNEELIGIIKQGPYSKKPREEKVVGKEVTPKVTTEAPQGNEDGDGDEGVAAASSSDDVSTLTPTLSVQQPPLPKEVTQEVVREILSAREKLEQAGRDDEIPKIQETLSYLLSKLFTDYTQVPNTFIVPVSFITEAILGHMGLPRNSSGTYRGIIAGFYSSTVRLFGYKEGSIETSVDEEARYADWVLDGEAIVAFIGGEDKIAHYAHLRKLAMDKVDKEEQEKKVSPPPTAAEVEYVVNQGFYKDAEVLTSVHEMLQARDEAVNKLAIAEANLQSIQNQIDLLNQQLDLLRAQSVEAVGYCATAQQDVEKFTPSPELLAKLQDIRERITAVFNKAGLQ